MKGKTPAIVFGSVLLAACSGGPLPGSAVPSSLPPCPSSPNCVSTQAADPGHAIAPLAYKAGGTVAEARAATMDALVQVVGRMKRTRIVQRTEGYLHVEYRTLVGFVDDVEFLLEDTSRTVHFRSASRLGKGDLGVNRRRMDSFRALYDPLS